MIEHLGVYAVMAVCVAVLQAQLTTLSRALRALQDGREKDRKAADSSAGHPSSVESTHEDPRPTPRTAGGYPMPPQAPRLISPTRAKLQMERKFTAKAQAAAVLRRAAEEQAR